MIEYIPLRTGGGCEGDIIAEISLRVFCKHRGEIDSIAGVAASERRGARFSVRDSPAVPADFDIFYVCGAGQKDIVPVGKDAKCFVAGSVGGYGDVK